MCSTGFFYFNRVIYKTYLFLRFIGSETIWICLWPQHWSNETFDNIPSVYLQYLIIILRKLHLNFLCKLRIINLNKIFTVSVYNGFFIQKRCFCLSLLSHAEIFISGFYYNIECFIWKQFCMKGVTIKSINTVGLYGVKLEWPWRRWR